MMRLVMLPYIHRSQKWRRLNLSTVRMTSSKRGRRSPHRKKRGKPHGFPRRGNLGQALHGNLAERSNGGAPPMKPEPTTDAPGVASHALFGSPVLLRRGGHGAPSPGQFRYVEATYIGANGHQVRCRLEQDDPAACFGYCAKKGDVGWWGRSIMFPPNVRPLAPADNQTPTQNGQS